MRFPTGDSYENWFTLGDGETLKIWMKKMHHEYFQGKNQ